MAFETWHWRLEATIAALQVLAALVAIWAGLSRRHWFVRGVVVLAIATIVLLPPRAHQPAVLFVSQAFIVAACCGVVRWWHARQTRTAEGGWHFSLADLLKGTFLFAGVLALFAHSFRQPFMDIAGWIALRTGMNSLVTLFAAWVALGRGGWRQWSMRLVFASCAVVLAGYVHFQIDLRTDATALLMMTGELLHESLMRRVRLMADIGFGVWLSLIFIATVTWRSYEPSRIPASQQTWRFWAIRGAGFMVATITTSWLGYVWWKMTFLPKPPSIVLPTPNGYDTMLLAATLLSGKTDLDPITASLNEYRASVEKNRAALAKAIEAMLQPWQYPLAYTNGSDDPDIEGITAYRSLSRALRIRATVEGESKDFQAAATSQLLAIQIGARMRSGGLLIHALVGGSIESGCREPVVTWQKLNAMKCRQVISELLRIDASREPIQSVLDRDAIWCAHALGYATTFENAVMIQSTSQEPSGHWFAQDTDSRTRLLILDIATQLFRLEQRRLPESLTELTPRYLSRQLVDAYHNKPFVYRKTGDETFLLFSCGPDGDDDGGMRPKWPEFFNRQDGDVFLEYLDDRVATPAALAEEVNRRMAEALAFPSF